MLGALVTAGSFAVNNLDSIGNAIGGLFGGDKPQPTAEFRALVNEVYSRLSAEEKQQVAAGWAAATGKSVSRFTAEELPYVLTGGSDRQLKSVAETNLSSLFASLARKYGVGSYTNMPNPEPSTLQQSLYNATQVVQQLPSAIAQSTIEKIAEGAGYAAAPIVREKTADKIAEYLPLVLIGFVGSLLLRGMTR